MNDYKEPEWTAKNMNRQSGDTDFETCGWCQYVGGGSCRYQCHLSSSCTLLEDYGNPKKVFWDTECAVMKLGSDDIAHIIKSKGYSISSLKSQIESAKEEIKVLNGLKSKLSKKPPLPDRRIKDYKLGEVVWVFHDSKWNRGTVVSGYRSGDGCVSYVLDDYAESKKGWGCGTGVPCVLKNWEYQYFKKHIDDFKTWIDLSDREYNGDRLDMPGYLVAMEKKEV